MSGIANGREPVSVVESKKIVDGILKELPKKTGEIRKKHVLVKDSCEVEQKIEANQRTIPGILTNRGCAYAGSKGVVFGPVKDILHITHGPPSYSESHEEGYDRALMATVQALARRKEPNAKVNLILGSVISPAEVRYIKDLLDCWGRGYLLLPDISDTFDSPLCEDLPRIPKGGTPLDDIRDMANSVETVTLGGRVQKASAGAYLEKEFNVRHTVLPLPIGVEYTDLMVAKLEEFTGSKLPRKYENERGRLLDALVDVHKQLAKVKAAINGDKEMVLGIANLMTELGMDPKVLATGAMNDGFAEMAAEIAPRSSILRGVDFDDIHKAIISNDVDLMIGPSTGRQISKEEKIPLLRVGLPNHDRFGAARQMVLGYAGAMRLVDDMANLLLDRR